MNTLRKSLAMAMALTFAGFSGLLAQRRTTDGGGSSGRSSPPSGGQAPARGSSSAPARSGGAPASSGQQPGSPGYRDRGGSQAQAGRSQQGGGSPGGKIGAIKTAAQAARARANGGFVLGRGVFVGTCWGCDYYGWYGGYWGWYHGGWWYPAYYPGGGYYGGESGPSEPGQGYDDYPYAGDGQDAFAHGHSGRRAFGAVSGNFFSDAGSSTRAGRFSLEGAVGVVRGELEYGDYHEPVAGGTNTMQTYRIGIGGQPRLSDNAYLIAGVAARGLALDDGSHAWGPEGELGLQLFPVRPFGFNVTGRLGSLSWNGASDNFTLKELNTTGSVFINRLELQAGWHWLQLGNSPAFGGPIAGIRLWF